MGLPAGHVVSQLRQCAGTVMSVSQPSLPSALQCSKPGAHAVVGTTHAPATHCTPAVLATFGKAAQSLPQAPQFAGSFCRSKQVLPGHSVKVGRHAMPQALSTHVALPPLSGAGQVVAQSPQCLGSLSMLTQL